MPSVTALAPKILITGSTGKVGGELLRLFIENGGGVCALVRKEEQARQLISMGVEPRIGDFHLPQTLPAALDGIEKLYLLYPDRADRVQAETTLIDAAKRAGVRHIVKQSAYAASLQPPLSFGISLAETDRYLMDSGLEWTILRPYAFMQNFLDVAPLVAKRGILPMPFGNAKVCFIDCRDIAKVAQRVLREEGHSQKTYYLSGSKTMSMAQVADVLTDVLKRKVRYISPPFFIARYGLKQFMSEYEITQLKPLLKMLKAGGEETPFADVERICNNKPRDIETFIRDHIKAFSAG